MTYTYSLQGSPSARPTLTHSARWALCSAGFPCPTLSRPGWVLLTVPKKYQGVLPGLGHKPVRPLQNQQQSQHQSPQRFKDVDPVIEFPEYIDSPETLEYFGFTPRAVHTIYTRYKNHLSGKHLLGNYRYLALMPFVHEYMNRSEINEDACAPEHDWDDAMMRIGMDESLRDAVLAEEFKDIRMMKTAGEWCLETMRDDWEFLNTFSDRIVEVFGRIGGAGRQNMRKRKRVDVDENGEGGEERDEEMKNPADADDEEEDSEESETASDDEMYDEDEDADEEEADPEEYEDNLEDEEEDDDKDDVEGNREREPRTIFFKGGSRLHLETSVPGSFPGTLTGVAQLMTGTECDFSFHEPQLYLTQNYHYAKHMADYARCRIDRVRQITIDSGRLNGHDIFGFANMLGTARGAGILHIEIPTRFIKDRIKDIRGTLWQKYVFFCRKRFSVLGSFPEQLYAAPILRGPILAVNNHVARRFSFDPENVVPFRMRRAENRWGVRSSGRSASTRGGEEGEELLRVGEFMRLSNESRRSRENGDFSEMWRLSNLADAMLDDGGSMTQGNYGRLDGMEGDIVLQTSFKRKMALENERHWVFKYEGLEE